MSWWWLLIFAGGALVGAGAVYLAFVLAFARAWRCDHDFQGWREFEDGCGGEQVCTKCGMGAMQFILLSCT